VESILKFLYVIRDLVGISYILYIFTIPGGCTYTKRVHTNPNVQTCFLTLGFFIFLQNAYVSSNWRHFPPTNYIYVSFWFPPFELSLSTILIPLLLTVRKSGFGGLGVCVLASGTQVRGFKPGRSRRIFKGGKILSTGHMSQICGM
jgi:hypothetical protein